jgi:hypothetical protein
MDPTVLHPKLFWLVETTLTCDENHLFVCNSVESGMIYLYCLAYLLVGSIIAVLFCKITTALGKGNVFTQQIAKYYQNYYTFWIVTLWPLALVVFAWNEFKNFLITIGRKC